MRQGSLIVRTGDIVARGQRLGDVGYSGKAKFSHLHLSVRHNGETVDPFSGQPQDSQCYSPSRIAKGLWNDSAAKILNYPGSQVFAVSFSNNVPALEALERNHVRAKPHKKSGKLILLARFLNLREGDRIRLSVNGPAEFHVKRISTPLERHKATYMAYIGKRRTSPSWPPGRYEGHAQILRGDVVISEMRSVFALPE